MYCPNCGHEQICPCGSCTERRRNTETACMANYEKPWIWSHGEIISCGKCGLTAHADWWEDLETDVCRFLVKKP